MDEPTVQGEHTRDPPLVRAGRWFQATPAELTGLAVLLTGALAASVLLWWSATGRPSQLPNAAAQVGEVVDGAASRSAGDDDAPGDADAGAQAGPAQPAGSTAQAAEEPDQSVAPEDVTVHVTGAVEEPGVVVLRGAARVSDAVDAAGGLLPDAAPERINLARPIVDGEHIHVPRPGENPPLAAPAPKPGSGGSGGVGTATAPDGRIDINRATASELETLPGIGPAKAAAIIEYRDASGPFTTPGDLRNVTGIGEKTFQKLADLVSVG